MDFDKIVISDFEKDILDLIRKQDKLNDYQIHGYFKFPSFESVLIATQKLEKLGLVYKENMTKLSLYKISNDGETYYTWLNKTKKKDSKKFVNSVLLTIIGAVVGAIIGFLAKSYLY